MKKETKKRVLLFALTYYPKFVGGDGVAIKEITDRISDNEYEFHMVTLRLDSTLPKYEKFGNVHIYRVGFSKELPTPEELVKFPMYFAKILFPISACIQAVKLHKKHSYDFLWGMMAYAGFPIVFFNMLFPKVPILLTLQDGDPIEVIVGRARVKAVLPLFKRIFKITTHIQSISNYLAMFARGMGYKKDITIVPNGVDYEKFASVDRNRVGEQRLLLEKKFKEVVNPFMLFTASRLVKKNANDIVIRSLKEMPDRVVFVIAGLGPDEQMLRQLAKSEGVSDRVLFLGHQQFDDLPTYYHASDCFIRPSRTEGFGNSFIEAMAANVPVIATTAGGIKDFLFHDENGLEVGIESTEDIATQVHRLLNETGLRERITKNAKEMAKEMYDWNIIVKQMKEVFAKMVDKEKGSATK